jgi:hypothetical protein
VIDMGEQAALLEASDYVWGRLRSRLEGMPDQEYLWEPVSGCWSIRPGPDGGWRWDFEDVPPAEAPLSTVAWRLTHITAGGDTLRGGIDATGDRRRPWLGLAPRTGQVAWEVPQTADDARAAVERAREEMHAELELMTDDSLWEAVGDAGGPYRDASRFSYVVHILDEVIHHGAEIGVLRDLYRVRDRLRS